MDGEQYACVSRNLAFGKGSFWLPFLSESWLKQGSNYFMEQPPLFYWLESLFFNFLGDSMYTERLFSIFMMLLNVLLIHSIWILIVPINLSKLSWVSILFWIITPVCFWSIQNNIIELTLSFFTLTASFFILKGLYNKKKFILNFIVGGVFVFLSTLTKGFQGLFPLVIVFIYFFLHEEISLKKTVLFSLIILLVPIVIYALIILIDRDIKDSLSFYFHQRLMLRINSEPTTNSRFYILWLLFQELIPIFLISLIIFLFKLKNKVHNSNEINKRAMLFILIGISASFPLMFTLVQKNFYFLAAIPFFAIGFSLLNINIVLQITEWIHSKLVILKVFKTTSIILIVLSISFSIFQIGKVSRDEEMLHDVYIIGNYLKNEQTIDTDSDVYYTWNFQFYLLRKFNLSLNPISKKQKYFITEKSIDSFGDPNYKQVNLATKKYNLFIKISN